MIIRCVSACGTGSGEAASMLKVHTALSMSAGQRQKLHTAIFTTAWRGNWAACSPDRSPIQNIWSIMKWKTRQRRSRQESEKNESTFVSEKQPVSLIFPDVYGLSSVEGMLHVRMCCCQQNQKHLFSNWNGTFSQLKHLICCLCSTVNKIFAFCFYLYFPQHASFLQLWWWTYVQCCRLGW